MNRLKAYVRQFDSRLWVLVFGWFVAAIGFSASMPFLSIYFRERLGLTNSEIGLFFAGIAVFRVVSQAVGGELSDRIGRHALIVQSQTFRAVTFVFIIAIF